MGVEITGLTSRRPRRARLLRKLGQKVSASEGPICSPTISRLPSVLAPTSSIAPTETMRPPSRCFKLRYRCSMRTTSNQGPPAVRADPYSDRLQPVGQRHAGGSRSQVDAEKSLAPLLERVSQDSVSEIALHRAGPAARARGGVDFAQDVFALGLPNIELRIVAAGGQEGDDGIGQFASR